MRVRLAARSIRGLAASLAAVTLLACGGDEAPPAAEPDAAEPAVAATEPAAPAGAIDPCALITPAEAAEALGATPNTTERPTEANHPPAMVTCRWVAPKGQAVAVMTLMVRTSADAASARIGFQAARDAYPGAAAVSGLGEDAYVFADQLNVLKGDVHLILTGDFDAATSRRLAESALQRLP